MHPAIRTQADGAQEEYSEMAVIDCADSMDMARQEYKDEADVNVILARFGIHAPQKQTTFGEVDYTIDLQTAFGAIEAAKQAHARLPEDLRKDYPTWQTLLNAIERGEITVKEGQPEPPAPEPSGVTPHI